MSTEAVFEFIETESQYQEFQACIEELKGQRGAQMPALQEAQRIYGYLMRKGFSSSDILSVLKEKEDFC